MHHLFCLFCLRTWRRTELFYSDRQTGLMNLFAIPRLYYSGNQTKTYSRPTEISIIMRAETSTGEGSGEAQKIFIFWRLEMPILVHSQASLSIRVWAVIRPTPVLRSVKKDRNGVPVIKKRTGTAFRCVPVPNEPCGYNTPDSMLRDKGRLCLP